MEGISAEQLMSHGLMPNTQSVGSSLMQECPDVYQLWQRGFVKGLRAVDDVAKNVNFLHGTVSMCMI